MRVTGLRITAGSMVLLLDILKVKIVLQDILMNPWHIRYVGKELAKTLYNNGNWLSLEEYFGIDSKYSD